jgi:hypothetical protein
MTTSTTALNNEGGLLLANINCNNRLADDDDEGRRWRFSSSGDLAVEIAA